MAEAEVNEELASGRVAREKSMRQFSEQTKGKPTPTQEENDRAVAGEHILEHEADGSDPDVNEVARTTRQMEAKPGGGYQTRQAQPKTSQPAKPAT